MRLATATFKRDGVIDNIHTGNDIDDRDNMAGRLSIDFDISEKTQMELTYDYQKGCLLYTSPSPRDGLLSRMPSSA